MVAQGHLDSTCGAYLNAALGCHAFCILHHCTHESISQSNPEHQKFENVVFRLASMLIFFDDGYKEAHRAHHQRTNEPDDPDLILSHSPLPVLGNALFHMTNSDTYLGIGVPITPLQLQLLHSFGLVGHVAKENSWIVNKVVWIDWGNMVLKMASYSALKVMEATPEFCNFRRTLQATWRTSNSLTWMLLALFFARYPHRNGITCKNEVDSYYDGTYRGQGQVDLWMMGEGPHHMHHAKSNVSYALLPKISEDHLQS
eukprot:gnl/MRDRNA2_/MRDRNA2_24815_c0_seq2.p1 gnl/MRDRNA2_/MRDRNA2_24815_c0~~gnl/MRDRNA2_/MRDRNA2_24815_c0_seq2.p1  ORF type:complete len:269 (+),score=35.12 gnl/MRDRNA2_/MRDRNA2_24815_c0_seq2:38-808(+)